VAQSFSEKSAFESPIEYPFTKHAYPASESSSRICAEEHNSSFDVGTRVGAGVIGGVVVGAGVGSRVGGNVGEGGLVGS